MDHDPRQSYCEIAESESPSSVNGSRLREQTLAQTYVKPSSRLTTNVAWNEICTLTQINALLAFSPQSSLDTQLFLPELCHIITLLLDSGSVLMRQTVYGLFANVIHSLAASQLTGDMDGPALQRLMVTIQGVETVSFFGLVSNGSILDLSGEEDRDGADVSSLAGTETIAKLLGEVISAGAVSIGKCNLQSYADDRLRECLAGAMDGARSRYMLSTQPRCPTASVHCARIPRFR